MVLTKLAITCALLTVGQAPADVVHTNLRSGRIPRDINPQRIAEIRDLQLFMSPDKGRTWNAVDKITPDKDGFSYFTPGDGEYWYQVVVTNQQGKQEPADLFKTPPMMKLVVDTKPPELMITSAQRQGDELVVSWSVREDNPDPPKLKLEYRPADSNLWTPIPLTPSPQGTAKARINTGAGAVVRLQFKDMAGNAAAVETEVAGGTSAIGQSQPAPANYAHSNAAPQLPPPPAAPDKTPLPLPPPAQPVVAAVAPGSGVSAVMPQPAPTAVKQATIASTNDASQGSPVRGPVAGAPRVMPELQLVNEPEVVLEYQVSNVGPSGVGKVEVWITKDGGTNWMRFAEDPEASQATNGGQYQRTLPLPGEGVYGISLVVKSKAGMGRPGPRPGDVPEMLLEVDTTPPDAQLHPLLPDPQQRDTILLSWTAKDKNLATTPITLEWAERPAGPWQPIAANVQNTGRHPWRLPHNLPSHVYLKLTVRDGVGNTAVAVTREAQLVDLSEPEGRLLRVTPASKK